MTRGTLPPQAYTKEVLLQAVQWLQSQPDHVKALVNSQDMLVSLYLKVKRNGEATLETLSPASAEKFRSDLKTIAAEMQQFAVPVHPAPLSPLGATPYSSHMPPAGTSTSVSSSRPSTPTAASHVTKSPEVESVLPVSEAEEAPVSPSSRAQPWADILDAHSVGIIQDVKQRFNLSHETEALRLLIAAGYDKIRNVLPS